jgi:hypothetical protein
LRVTLATQWIWVATRALRWSPLSMVMGLVCFLLALTGVDWPAAATASGTFVTGSLVGAGMVPNYERRPNRPGEALRISGRWLATLIGATFIVGIIITLVVWLAGGCWLAALAAIPLSASLLMVTGPGRAWLRTRALSYGSRKSGLLPRSLVDFLDHSAERALLRRQGGGYAFLHSSLQDYFAAADVELI